MMLITIAYLACAAFVLVHVARSPLVDDDEGPIEPADRSEPEEGAPSKPVDAGRVDKGPRRLRRSIA